MQHRERRTTQARLGATRPAGSPRCSVASPLAAPCRVAGADHASSASARRSAAESGGLASTPALPAGTAAGDFAVLVVAGRPTRHVAAGRADGLDVRAARDLRDRRRQRLAARDVLPGAGRRRCESRVTLPANWVGWQQHGMSVADRGLARRRHRRRRSMSPTRRAVSPPSDRSRARRSRPRQPTRWSSSVSRDQRQQRSCGSARANGFTARMSGTDYDTNVGGDHADRRSQTSVQAAAGAVDDAAMASRRRTTPTRGRRSRSRCAHYVPRRRQRSGSR